MRFIFCLHVHQPVGNFDHVFEEHVRDVYMPLLEKLAEREFWPVVLHISGPLLEWLEAHGAPYLDLVGRFVSEGRIELLLSGMYEPVLVALPRPDRLEQIFWLRDAVQARFGVEPTGLWLTERVWEPDLPSDLSAAGIQYTLVDDRHFLVSGFRADQLYTHYTTEAGGDRLSVFPIHERLRYLIPFRPTTELETYFRERHASGAALAVFADDGEKFGGWPGTREWVYDRGWLNDFLKSIERLRQEEVLELTTGHDALRLVPSGGMAYLPSASYREMEVWSLPAEQGRRLTAFAESLGEDRLAGPDGAFVRGGHWHNFFVKYPESNRAHKMMLALSSLARESGDPPSARRAIGRAQCNDPSWHGVFGGLYLPHLRHAIWAQLAKAEGELRRREALRAEVTDIDGDGEPEIWVHSSKFSAVVAPHRGAGVEVYSVFAHGVNYVDVLTRRLEAYHKTEAAGAETHPHERSEVGGSETHPPEPDGAPSIHDLERGRVATGTLPIDAVTRALFLDRLVAADLDRAHYETGRYVASLDWASAHFGFVVESSEAFVDVVCTSSGLEKRLRFADDGTLTVTYRFHQRPEHPLPSSGYFTTELSLAYPCRIEASSDPEIWVYAIDTIAQSERGIERTTQGESTTLRWSLAGAGPRDGLTVTVRPSL